jgi:hypothetical protein
LGGCHPTFRPIKESTDSAIQGKSPTGKLSRCNRKFESLNRPQPSDPQSNYHLGLLLAARNRNLLWLFWNLPRNGSELSSPVRALADGIRSARRADDPAFALVAAGRALASIGEWDLAAGPYRSDRLRPDYAEAWAFLGKSSNMQMKMVSSLTKAIETSLLLANGFLALYWRRQRNHDRGPWYTSPMR